MNARRSDGHVLHLAGTDVLLRPSGAALLIEADMLMAADLHLEKGSAYAARGQLLPPYDTRETLERLEREIIALTPRFVVLLGDSWHDEAAGSRLHPAHREHLEHLSRRTELIWISGNHDPSGDEIVGGEIGGSASIEDLRIANLVLRHEPEQQPAPGEVAGHLHPCAKVRGPAGAVRRRCFVSDGQRLIMPAFGAYAGGLNVMDAAFHGLFIRPPVSFLLGDQIRPIPHSRLTPDAR